MLFLVMEFIGGETLHQRLSAGTLPLAEAMRIAGEIAEALEEAHSNRFVHRDLKPANIMLAQGHVKVMDFGLAKQFGETTPASEDAPTLTFAGPALTKLGAAIGTPDYMSPEQVKGERLRHRACTFEHRNGLQGVVYGFVPSSEAAQCRSLLRRELGYALAFFTFEHRQGIFQTAPCRPAQPIAREWYALMLLDRNAAGDHAKARGLLSEALAMYEAMEMPFQAKRTSGRLASL